MSFTKRAPIIGCGVLALAVPQLASAATIGFENPPYVPGPLVGQDGWVSNSYNPLILGGLNGTVEVSTSAPLAGDQSLLYTQTAGPGASDVSKAGVVSTINEGSGAADLTGSVLLQAGPNANGNGQLGLFLSSDADAGSSPIGILLEGNATSGGPGVIYVIDNTYSAQTGGNPFRPAGTYVANDVFQFAFGVDFDSSSYQAAYKNVTAGDTAFTPLIGGNPDGSFAFFGGFPAEGDGTYSVDIGAFLRDGVGRIDNITLTPIPEPATLGIAMLGAGILTLRRRNRATC